ncbi:MAG: hypothetical protein F6J93_17185 [Oscillatoria sp. SIO1A7]|nr:hypothetical protein [Oscillatoria sp. SIO1A7]
MAVGKRGEVWEETLQNIIPSLPHLSRLVGSMPDAPCPMPNSLLTLVSFW